MNLLITNLKRSFNLGTFLQLLTGLAVVANSPEVTFNLLLLHQLLWKLRLQLLNNCFSILVFHVLWWHSRRNNFLCLIQISISIWEWFDTCSWHFVGVNGCLSSFYLWDYTLVSFNTPWCNTLVEHHVVGSTFSFGNLLRILPINTHRTMWSFSIAVGFE